MYSSRSGQRRSPRFDEYYRCYPMVMAPGPERPELDHGSKIFLPPSALDKISKMNVQWPLQMELINGANDNHTHAGVLEFVAEEGRAYIPHWMMKTLQIDVGDLLQVRTTSLSLAKLVKLQPQSVDFLEISDPRAVLEKAFRAFSTLTKGDVFTFEYNDDIYSMEVLEVKPESPLNGVSMIETDVEVDFAPPVGYVEPERKPASASATGTSGGIIHSHGSMANVIGYAELAPDALAAVTPVFHGEGYKLTNKKASAAKVAKIEEEAKSEKEENFVKNGAKPLRLPDNVLFFGYHVKPLQTPEDKIRELEKSKQPKFEGQGQSLRAKKK